MILIEPDTTNRQRKILLSLALDMEIDTRNILILNLMDEPRNVEKLQLEKDNIISYAVREYGLEQA